MPLQSKASARAPARPSTVMAPATANRTSPRLRIDPPSQITKASRGNLWLAPFRAAKDHFCELDYLSPLDAPLTQQSIQNCDKWCSRVDNFSLRPLTPIAQPISGMRPGRDRVQSLAGAPLKKGGPG